MSMSVSCVRVCVSVCLLVCLSARAYFRNYMNVSSPLIFMHAPGSTILWAALRYVMYFRFYE